MTRQVLGWPILHVIILIVAAPTVEVPPKGAAGGGHLTAPPPLLPYTTKRSFEPPNGFISALRGDVDKGPLVSASVDALATSLACAWTRASPQFARDVIVS